MPLPFILAGAAIAAGAFGAKKGFDAKSDMDSAKEQNEKAKSIIDSAQSDLEDARKQTQNIMESLGELKIEIWSTSLVKFIDLFSRIKNISATAPGLSNDNTLPTVDVKDYDAMSKTSFEMKDLATGGTSAIGGGGLAGVAAYGGAQVLATASTGTAIGSLSGAAATNATLAWFGGGSLASGGLGVAGGTAVLGGIVAGPVLAIGGMIMASKAEEAKEHSMANLKEAEEAEEHMKTARVSAEGIGKRFQEVDMVLRELDDRFVDALPRLQSLVERKQRESTLYKLGRFIQRRTNGNWYWLKKLTNPRVSYSKLSTEEKQGVYMISAMAKTIKNVLDAQLLGENGELTKDSRTALDQANKFLKKL